MRRLLTYKVRFSFSEAKSNSTNPISQNVPYTKPEEYLVFPTKFPIFPYYVYTVKINKYLYEYLTKNSITYVTIFPIKPGTIKQKFYPYSLTHLQSELKLNPIIQKPKENQNIVENIQATNNNIIFDQQINSKSDQQVPVHFVNHVNQIFPIGSICKFQAVLNNNSYVGHFRSEIRLEIDPSKYMDQQGPLMYVSGKTLRNENLLQIGNQHKSLMQLYQKIKEISHLNLPQVANSSIIKSVELLSGYLCTLAFFTPYQLFGLYRITNLAERVKLLIQYYSQYITVLQASWKNFQQKNTMKMNEQQKKETIQDLHEQLQNFLGQTGQTKFIAKIKNILKSGRYPEHIVKVIQCQLQNLSQVKDRTDAKRRKHFINLLITYPFGVRAEESFDVYKAKEILQEDHYGMKKVKERILQFIAVSKLKGQFKSKVLLLYGPPGVGKTSIVKSIAKCLNRPYGRISLGGQSDVSIMKGHRKTYIGAYPGKIFDTISKLKVQNPVILLDQIDKIGARGYQGNLQDVVMQILDPVQNNKFKDDFMDVQIDLSNVLFICTANSLQTIFPPLLDRMQRIQVSGYTTPQKIEIFNRYIYKQILQQNGLQGDISKDISLPEQSVNFLIEGYCKEAGVRNLVRKTNKIFQKIALMHVQNQQYSKMIAKQEIKKYLGLPRFHEGRLFDGIPPAGVMIGLAYNSYGGSIMYIEATSSNLLGQNRQLHQKPSSQPDKNPSKHGSLVVTGNIHDVMKQSCQLAYSYAKYVTSTFFQNNFLELNDIHLNFPEIQIGKDGPSAGIAITSTLISLALNKPAFREIAMTGQITLSGKVSAIGGVKQKTMGAKRQGITTLIFPQQNRRDIEQLQENIKEGITFHFASHYFEVLKLVFDIKI